MALNYTKMNYEIVEDLLQAEDETEKSANSIQLAGSLAKQILAENDFSNQEKRKWKGQMTGFANKCQESRYLIYKEILGIRKEVFEIRQSDKKYYLSRLLQRLS